MKASRLALGAAIVFVLTGMLWGIHMAASGDHAAMPAHAHVNLLGWVSLFLFGLYYQSAGALDRSRAAVWQVSIWIVATVVLAIGVALVTQGREALGEPFATIGSLALVADVIFFAVLFVRAGRARDVAVAPVAAE